MKKRIALLLLAAICVASAFIVTACSKAALTAEFKEEIEDAVCFYKEEFDLEPYIAKQGGVKYTVYAVQLNDEFDEIELEVDGFKFTPTEKEDVLVKFTAEKGGQKVTSKEIKIFLELKPEPIVAKIVESPKDDGFSKEVNIDETYIRSGNKTSAYITWFGKEPSYIDRFQYVIQLLGDEEVTACYSVTDWSDAVLSFWVFNPTEYEIEFAPMWAHDGAEIALNYGFTNLKTVQVAKPGVWTEIKYSLRYYGITENFYYDVDAYYSFTDIPVDYGYGTNENTNRKRINTNWWTCRWGGRETENKYFEYSFYVDGFDIRNYDETVDADLKHDLKGFFFFDEEETVEAESGTIIDVLNNDGKTFTFEYKIVSEGGAFGVALIEEDWGKNYFGYFFFDKTGETEDYNGVTVEDLNDGFKKVVFDLETTDKITVNDGSEPIKPSVVKTFYIRDGSDYNSADVVLRKVGINLDGLSE